MASQTFSVPASHKKVTHTMTGPSRVQARVRAHAHTHTHACTLGSPTVQSSSGLPAGAGPSHRAEDPPPLSALRPVPQFSDKPTLSSCGNELADSLPQVTLTGLATGCGSAEDGTVSVALLTTVPEDGEVVTCKWAKASVSQVPGGRRRRSVSPGRPRGLRAGGGRTVKATSLPRANLPPCSSGTRPLALTWHLPHPANSEVSHAAHLTGEDSEVKSRLLDARCSLFLPPFLTGGCASPWNKVPWPATWPRLSRSSELGRLPQSTPRPAPTPAPERAHSLHSGRRRAAGASAGISSLRPSDVAHCGA